MTNPESSLIGVKSYLTHPISKQDFLLFDEIVSPFLTALHLDQLSDQQRAEVEWLIENGLLSRLEADSLNALYSTSVDETSTQAPLLLALAVSAGMLLISGEKEPGDLAVFWPMVGDSLRFMLHVSAKVVEASRGIRSVPLLDDTWESERTVGGLRTHGPKLLSDLKSLPRRIRYRTLEDFLRSAGVPLPARLPDIRPIAAAESLLRDYLTQAVTPQTTLGLEVVLQSLPVPDDSVSWEQIADFRSNGTTRMQLLRLRKWIRQISSTTTEPKVLREELEDLLAEYREHVRREKVRTRDLILKTILTTPAEIVEHLLHLRPNSAFQTLFKVRDIQLDRWAAENDAPGREVAYIIAAHRQFGR